MYPMHLLKSPFRYYLYGMNGEQTDKLATSLALALIYLSAWQEKEPFGEVHRAWKGYDFAILDQLKAASLIDFSYKAKSLYLTEEGIAKAKAIIDKLSTLQL